MSSQILRFLVSFTGLLTAVLGAVSVWAADVPVTPEPDWVRPVAVDVPAQLPGDQISGGLYDLLYEQQVKVSEGEQVRYVHTARLITNRKGVERAGQLSVDFNPGYETLRLHHLRVIRHGRTYERLGETPVSLLRRETELEYLIYDGSITANMILSDLRVGDIVEFSYSVSGANPIFGSHFATGFSTRWAVPVHRLRYRLLWQRAATLQIRNHGEQLVPVVHRTSREVEYQWAFSDLTPLRKERDTPDDYDAYAWVQLTDWQSWSELVHWALPLFRVPQRLTGSLAAEVARIESAHSDPGERTVAALRFVQDEIRYLGIEMGEGSHAPREPAQVLANRFGDCKDKSRLLVALLRAMDIEAVPVLVDNTGYKNSLTAWAPSPGAFNHVIVRATLAGLTYWLDPTESWQRGDFEHLVQADFGLALPIADDSEQLVAMEPRQPVKEGDGTRVDEIYYMGAGMQRPINYQVKTAYHGRAADDMRRYLADESRAALASNYLDYYLQQFPGITSSGPIRVDDDPDRDILTVTESYRIPSLAKKDGKGFAANFYPQYFADQIDDPPTGRRTMPLKVRLPAHVVLSTRVMLPETWPIEPEQEHVSSPAFDFTSDIRVVDRVLTLRYELTRLTRRIEASAVSDHATQLGRVRDALGYQLTWNDAAPAESAFGYGWLIGGISFAVLFGVGVLFRGRRRRVGALAADSMLA